MQPLYPRESGIDLLTCCKRSIRVLVPLYGYFYAFLSSQVKCICIVNRLRSDYLCPIAVICRGRPVTVTILVYEYNWFDMKKGIYLYE